MYNWWYSNPWPPDNMPCAPTAELREWGTFQFIVWDTGSGGINMKCQPCALNSIRLSLFYNLIFCYVESSTFLVRLEPASVWLHAECCHRCATGIWHIPTHGCGYCLGDIDIFLKIDTENSTHEGETAPIFPYWWIVLATTEIARGRK